MRIFFVCFFLTTYGNELTSKTFLNSHIRRIKKEVKKKKKDLTTYSATLHLKGYSIMLECENGCLSLSHVLNSKVLLYTKLNVNFSITKMTKPFEP